MPLTDQDRILNDRLTPRIVTLWRAMQPLRSVTSFMQSGAHPDDETTAMLAALGLRDGFSLAYACANRGEGGQNDIGTEATEALGVLRTAEMERASDVLNMRLYWLSKRADDTIFDFGFSKSGVETLAKWGQDRTLTRMVGILRTERPDILCTTFLDVPGQHGHHRAMTQTALAAFDVAADPAFVGVDLPVWKISRLYLPAWSGAGGSYDDEVPPPPATTAVSGSGYDPVTGWDWARIGQQSRACHKTQGMGRWVPADNRQANWPLHCAMSRVSGDGLRDGVPTHFSDVDAPPSLDTRMAEVVDAFPDFDAVLASACAALQDLREVRAARPDGDPHAHRFDRAERALAVVIRLAAGVLAEGRSSDDWLRPGERSPLSVAISTKSGDVQAYPVVPAGWVVEADTIGPGHTARPSDPYPASYDPWSPPGPALDIDVTAHGVTSRSRVPLDVTPQVLPSHAARLTPEFAVLNRAAGKTGLKLHVSEVAPVAGAVTLTLPDGWTATQNNDGFDISTAANMEPGLYRVPVSVDGVAAFSERKIVYPHTAPRAWVAPAVANVRVLDVQIPDVRVGYIGAGNDRVDYWLRELGADCQNLSDADLAAANWADQFDTIVIGIFAMRFRAGLLDHVPALHDWVGRGGHLVTLYHRPWDHWDPDTIPPRRLEVGQPSLRWRVTDENADVTVLDPDHPLLNTPNRIGPDDWAGWHKERGLYFAKSWDAAYTPLLQMHDPDDVAHQGSLLSASVGNGRHTHCALILHYQMEKLVPGAFRLMANLIA